MAKITKRTKKFTVLRGTLAQFTRTMEIFESHGIKWASGQKASEYLYSDCGSGIFYKYYGNCDIRNGSVEEHGIKIYTPEEFEARFGSSDLIELDGKLYRPMKTAIGWVANTESEYKYVIVRDDISSGWHSPRLLHAILPTHTYSFKTDGASWRFAAEYVKDCKPKKVEMTIAEIEARLGINNIRVVKG